MDLYKDYKKYFTHREDAITHKDFFKIGFGPKQYNPKKNIFTNCPRCGLEISSLNAFRQHNRKKRERKTPICYPDNDELEISYYKLVNIYLQKLEQNHPAKVFNACLDDFLHQVATW